MLGWRGRYRELTALKQISHQQARGRAFPCEVQSQRTLIPIILRRCCHPFSGMTHDSEKEAAGDRVWQHWHQHLLGRSWSAGRRELGRYRNPTGTRLHLFSSKPFPFNVPHLRLPRVSSEAPTLIRALMVLESLVDEVSLDSRRSDRIKSLQAAAFRRARPVHQASLQTNNPSW